MNWSEILNIVLTIVGALIAFIGYYFKIKGKLIKEANDKIDEAEKDGVDGEEKMKYVVNELYDLVPVVYRKIFTKDFIQLLVQEVFDKIEKYAEKQVNKK